ncbi:neutral zinc metallopeptidase [Nonomuraea sp. NPDC050404]|uniref:neutral zinc metallopeptidase n=1 Tax=Nonomuraea sp. NPDC050404 TaxID=3155783 RepID=UPI0033E89487
MRTPRLALIAGALASVLFAGTAHAATAPAYKPVLTKNPLYKTGKLGTQTCEEPEVTQGTVEEAEDYFTAVMVCLDKAWRPVVKKAGYSFSTPKLDVITKPGEKTPCGPFPDGNVQAIYCSTSKSISFLLSPQIIEEPTDLALMHVLAHEYGHHVQQLTGILKETDKRFYVKRQTKDTMEGIRRSELQAQCMGAAFVGRVWDSLGRPDSDWNILVKGTHNAIALDTLGVRSGSDESHGSDAANTRWLQQGFKAQSASACNTWAASDAKVR